MRFRAMRPTWPAVAAVAALLSGGLALAALAEPRVLATTFDKGPEGWQVYDYNGGIAGGGNVFYPVTWEKSGGVNGTGYVWGDDARWRIDTPENPHSILALIIYRDWDVIYPFKQAPGAVKGDQLDLRDAEVSVALRGDKLDLKGAECYFWALDHQVMTRWHYKGQPLKISDGRWDKQTFVIKNDESKWYRSWAKDPKNPASLDRTLRECDSYGFSFVGFKEEVTGKLSMDELVITMKPKRDGR